MRIFATKEKPVTRLTGIALVAGATVVGPTAYHFLAQETPLAEAYGMWGDDQWTKFVVGLGCLWVGAFFGSVFRRLLGLQEQGVRDIEIGSVLGSIFRNVDFWLAVFATPIVLGGILKSMNEVGLGTLAILAVENGFLGSTVAEQLLKTRGHRSAVPDRS